MPEIQHRQIEPLLRDIAKQYPAVTLTGPRQSGKTTLSRAVFPDHAYINLEALDQREYARSDPRGLLSEHADGLIIDEIQHVPELASYLQEVIDQDERPGRFILTGSQHFGVTESVSQSLAGRTAIFNLLPLSLAEFENFGSPTDSLFEVLFTGGYPRIHAHKLDPERWLSDYVATYVERDVRRIGNVGDLNAFTQFLKLCAAHTAQEVNLSALGGDAGVSHNTARSWLSILEAGFLLFRAPAWHRNIRKQLVKSPKLHFLDAGLACSLLGIRNAEQLRHHPLRGAIFESWVASEIYKHLTNQGLRPDIKHYRESRGAEVDILVETSMKTIACEVKSGATIQPSFFANLKKFAERMASVSPPPNITLRLIYGGEQRQNRSDIECIDWQSLHKLDWQ